MNREFSAIGLGVIERGWKMKVDYQIQEDNLRGVFVCPWSSRKDRVVVETALDLLGISFKTSSRDDNIWKMLKRRKSLLVYPYQNGEWSLEFFRVAYGVDMFRKIVFISMNHSEKIIEFFRYDFPYTKPFMEYINEVYKNRL